MSSLFLIRNVRIKTEVAFQRCSYKNVNVNLLYIFRAPFSPCQDRSSHQRCSMKKGVLGNFAKFTGKQLCQSLFFNKVAGLACNFTKKETPAQLFSCEFCDISKNTFFTEHPWRTASVKGNSFQRSMYFFWHYFSDGYPKMWAKVVWR